MSFSGSQREIFSGCPRTSFKCSERGGDRVPLHARLGGPSGNCLEGSGLGVREPDKMAATYRGRRGWRGRVRKGSRGTGSPQRVRELSLRPSWRSVWAAELRARPEVKLGKGPRRVSLVQSLPRPRADPKPPRRHCACPTGST